jgi:hypothetical protein
MKYSRNQQIEKAREKLAMVHAGWKWPTAANASRNTEMLELLCTGQSARQVGARFGITGARVRGLLNRVGIGPWTSNAAKLKYFETRPKG